MPPSPRAFFFSQSYLKLCIQYAPSSSDFLCEVGWRLSAATSDVCETAYLFQRLSVAIQHYNSVLIYESFAAPEGQLAIPPTCFNCCAHGRKIEYGCWQSPDGEKAVVSNIY